MLIKKGGISRNIDEKNLQSYLDKGYEKVEQKQDNPPASKDIKKMTTAELEAKAIEIDVDITDCKNNAERAEKILKALEGVE